MNVEKVLRGDVKPTVGREIDVPGCNTPGREVWIDRDVGIRFKQTKRKE